MRLLCPHCQRGINIPDTEAGKEVKCTLCNESFIAPELMISPPVIDTKELFPEPPPPPTPSVNPNPEPVYQLTAETSVPKPPIPEPKPKPNPVVETPPIQTTSTTPPPIPSTPKADLSVYKHVHSFPIKLTVLQWIPAICMTLAFFLTFFTWVGLFPGGYTAYSQNAWQALFGNFSSDSVCEPVLQLEKTINEQIRTSWWLFFYLLSLFPAVILTWAGQIVTRYQLESRLPQVIRQYWKYRTQILIGLAGFTLATLLLQTMVGFGLQNGLQRGVETEFAPELEQAKNNSVEEQKVRVRMAVAVHNYHTNTTFWLRLTIYAHLLAVLSIVIENLLVRKGEGPPPRVAVMW
jgi:hypothetical protein